MRPICIIIKLIKNFNRYNKQTDIMKELHAHELRIGNCLRLGEVILKVSEINNNCFYTTEEDGNDFKSTVWDIEPIELTEEWLLKFGFIKSGTNTDSHWYKGDNEGISRIGLKQYKDLFNNNHISFDFNVGGAYCISSVDIKIEFVHQLQNLYFALTGEELRIK